jgi:hypothetical protein
MKIVSTSCFIFFCIFYLTTTTVGQEIKNITVFFKDADAFFTHYVENGSIKYGKLKKDRSELQPLIDFIGKTPLKDVDFNKRKAYLINCYNLLVINGVVDRYPIPTVMNTDGFFKKVQHKIGGAMMTLDYLEYKVIFKEFTDARLHFVLVCAAKGCPPIPNFAYTPDNVSEQINTQCQLALDNAKFLYLEDKEKKVKLSPIFQWYKDDFLPSVPEFINAHRTKKLPKDYELSYYEYDWRLNQWEEN